MSTQADVQRFVALAGPTFEWKGVGGSSRPPSTRPTSSGRKLTGLRKNLRIWIAGAQGGLCFDCGQPLNGEGEFCHIVSRGPGGSANGKGWIAGNIGVGHPTCNKRQELAGPVVLDAKRLDLVPTEWPKWSELSD